MIRKIYKIQSGFTLIELITVIGIIAILTAMVISIIDPFAQFQKARDAERKSDFAQIRKAVEQYYEDTGKYPSSTASFQIVGLNSGTVDWGTSNANNWPYMNLMPKDPESSRKYVYYSTGQSFWLYASLERGSKDTDSCNSGNACSSILSGGLGFPGQHACSPNGSTNITCNYGVSSPNTSP